MVQNEAESSVHSPLEAAAWVAALGVVVVLAVPWFLWRSSGIAYGLPVWLWWHIGWMLLAAVVFYAFSRRAWGLWVTP
jgi:hypothetical protein